MAKKKATIDRDVYNSIKTYAQNHSKEQCCAHFDIALSTLNKILRYSSFEDMRFRVRQDAHERYLQSKKRQKSNKKEGKMSPIITPPPVSPNLKEQDEVIPNKPKELPASVPLQEENIEVDVKVSDDKDELIRNLKNQIDADRIIMKRQECEYKMLEEKLKFLRRTLKSGKATCVPCCDKETECCSIDDPRCIKIEFGKLKITLE